MQSYWFKFIVQLLWRIIKGEGDKGDTREYEQSNGHTQEIRRNGSLSVQQTHKNDEGQLSRKKDE